MYKSKTVSLLLSFAVLASSGNVAARDTWDRVRDAGIAMVGIGAATAIGAAVYGALQPAKPEDVLRDAAKAYETLSVTHSQNIAFVREHVHAQPWTLSRTERRCLVDRLSERTLSRAQALYVCSNALASDIDYCSRMRAAIQDALSRTEEYAMRRELENRYDQLQTLEISLQTLRDILEAHKTYFKLCELEAEVSMYHARELALFEGRHGGANAQGVALCLGMRSTGYRGQSYIYLDYAERLASDINSLENALARSSSVYSSKMDSARRILVCLRHLQNIVLSDPEYHRSLRDKERMQLERERIRLEQERLNVERQRARMEAERAQIERERANRERYNASYCSTCGARRDSIQGIVICCCR